MRRKTTYDPDLRSLRPLTVNEDGSTTRLYECGCSGTLWPGGYYVRKRCARHHETQPVNHDASREAP